MSAKKHGILTKLSLGFIPFILVWVIDWFTKQWALDLTGPIQYGPLHFDLIYNHGILLGFFSQLPLLVKTVTLTTLGAAVLSSYVMVITLIPIRSLYLRFGLSILAGGIIGNVTDRFIHSAVVDFISLRFNNHSSTPIMNVADLFQWIGYALFLIGFYKDSRYYWPTQDWRNKFLINPSFQIRTGLVMGLFSFVTGFIILVFGLSFFQDNLAQNNVKFFLIYGSALIIFLSAAIAIIGVVLSHRVAGPIFALKRYLKDNCQGNILDFKLREHDEFKELETVLTKLNSEIHRLYEIERELNEDNIEDLPPPIPDNIISLDIKKKII